MKNVIVKNEAVSETLGVVLLIGIAVILISAEGAFIFAREGPDDLPHTSLREWMDTSEDVIYLKHCGGEAIKTDELEIIANINGEKYVYTSPEIHEELGNKSFWDLGEVLAIDARSEWGLDLKDYHNINLYLIDTPTEELVQKVTLTTDFRKAPYLTRWITPKGEVVDTSGGEAELSHVQVEDWKRLEELNIKDEDGAYTVYHPPKKIGTETDPTIYQEFDFGINPCLYGFRPGDSLTNATLKIVYRTNDNSLLKIELRFYDTDSPLGWTAREIMLPEKNAFNVTYIPLINFINTTEDLAEFTVRLEAVTNADSEKEVNIDYLALWIE
ncbi:type IV pilin [Methanosarcina sp. KYL-1]|uniref:type IV pilin N-terminal domain-containing protein n=1 Tax=Methanosarcina sp. KYL-1 TaxID=2602068 RepID=UPI00210116E9|nr:type IV pilin N-terminal domain-containing protein [Methanosarcina sp. KYL-1]MCQ1534703.1 type IV pilin [Methanosarcina sp. KYL-1]